MKTTMCSILLRELLLSAIVSNNYLICSLDNRQSRNEGAITSAMASNREGPEPERTRIAGRRFARCFRRSEEHTSELQSLTNLVCRLLLEKKKKTKPRFT